MMRETISHRPVQNEALPAPAGPYSPGVIFGQLVFVSGQAGRDAATGHMGAGVEEQTEQAIKNVQAILEAAGSGLDYVLRCGVFLVDMAEFPLMNAVYATHFKHRPARTTIQAAALPSPDMRVEVDAIGYIP